MRIAANDVFELRILDQRAPEGIAAHPQALGQPRHPRARLGAYVAASFSPPIADCALLATWTALWGLVIAQPAIAALHDAQYARYRAELEELLAACGLAAAARRRAAIAITALVDGLWLELCLSPAVLDAEEAGAIAEAQIVALLR